HIYDIGIRDGETTFQRSQIAEQRVLGIEQTLGDGAVVRVEGYERRLSHVRPQFLNVEYNITVFPELARGHVRIDPTSALARGIELSIRRDASPVAWSASYTLASANDRVNGVDVARLLDQRHTVYADLSYTPRAP